jgi:hypothetical protein
MTATSKQRRIIRERAEVRNCKYRITKEGEVHFYGRMPNSIENGWWLFAQSVEEAINCAA